MKNKLKALTAAIMAMLVFAGCTGGGGSSSAADTQQGSESSAPATAQGTETVEISFWHHMEGVNAEALEDVVETFNKTVGADYGIHVVSSFQGTNTGEKLNTLAQAGDWGNFPDTVQVASAAIPTIYGYDINVPIEDMYAKGEDIILERSSVIENNARTFTYMDTMVGMPFSNSTILMYYNKDLFTAAGLDAENPPATLAELADVITQLKAYDDSINGLNVQVKRYQLVNWVGGEGAYNFLGDNEGGRTGMMTKFTFGDDGSLMTYLDEWEKIISTGAYKPLEDNINEEFAMQLNAIAIMSSARIAKVQELVDGSFEWATAPLPAVNAGDTGGTAIGGSGLVMFDNNDEAKLRASWIFIQYLGGVDAQYEFCTRSGYIPMNSDVYNTAEWAAYEQENDKVVAAVAQLMASSPNVQEPFDLVTSEINTIIDEEMLKFGQGEQGKQETHDNIVARCNEKVAEYVEVNG